METLHHQLWIVSAINAVFGSLAAAILHALGREVPAHGDIIPDYLAIIIFLTLLLTAFSLFVRSRLSVEHPGKLQIVLEDAPELEVVARAKVESVYAREILGEERLEGLRAAQRRLRVALLRLLVHRRDRRRRRR